MTEKAVTHFYCRKEGEISEIKQKVENMEQELSDVKKEITGNGRPGLREETVRLNENLEHMNTKTLPELRTGVSGFLKFQQEYYGRKQGMEIVKKRDRWIIGVGITLLIALAGGMVTMGVQLAELIRELAQYQGAG